MSVRPQTSRRTALGGTAAGLALLAGCELGGGDSEDAPAGSGRGAAPGPDEAAPDVALVSQALAELAASAALVTAVRRRHAALREPLQPLLQTHRGHLNALTGASGDQPPSTTSRAPTPAGEALRKVRVREGRTQRRLARYALDAQSGALAGLLASMSAAVAQQLTQLPVAPPGIAGATPDPDGQPG